VILISGVHRHRHVIRLAILLNWIDRGCCYCVHWNRCNYHVIHCQMNCCFDCWSFHD
jgi:hypothetical protein